MTNHYRSVSEAMTEFPPSRTTSCHGSNPIPSWGDSGSTGETMVSPGKSNSLSTTFAQAQAGLFITPAGT